MRRPWNWPSTAPEPATATLTKDYGMPRAVASILARRGFLAEASLTEFLNPRLNRLADPMVLADMGKAVERGWRAVDAGETIFVHGDYDVDGITGTAFLTRTLRAVGANVVPFVPSRSEGYGLGDVGIAAAAAAGATVLITVDNGIRSFAEVKKAGEAGLDVIVLDHHQPADTLPEAYAIVNPQRGEHGDAFKNLAAVGVAAKFMHAMAAVRPGDAIREAYREALQLVALGTIADIVPLDGENRILVAHGLTMLGGSGWAGIKALKAVARMTRNKVSSTDVAFFIAPRINAAGRMGEARDALDLLLTDDPATAYSLAEKIEGLNRDRRKAEATMMAEAVEELRGKETIPPAVVMWSDSWPVGVVGIAANRVLEGYNRPAFLIAMDGERGRGSARSRSSFPLPEALAACDGLLEEHGGHAQAAGFEIRRENLEAFRARIEALAGDAEWNPEADPLEVEASVELHEIDPDCVRWLERLAPFGRGNPEPLLGCEGMVLSEDPSVVGKRHLRLGFHAGGRSLRGIAFNQSDRIKELSRGKKLDAVFHAAFDTWRGGQNVQLVIRDLRIR